MRGAKWNLSLVILLFAAWAHLPTFADDTEVPVSIEVQPIEAKVLRRSHSMRVTLFELTGGKIAPENRLLLLHDGETPIMALRVLRSEPDKNQFAARRIKHYGSVKTLDIGQPVVGRWKIRELAPPSPEVRKQDEKDLKELDAELDGEGPTAPSPTPVPAPSADETGDDPELDSPPDPKSSSSAEAAPPAFDTDLDTEELGPADEDMEAIALEDIDAFDTDRHWLSGQLGYVLARTKTGTNTYYMGGGARYGFTYAKNVLFNDSKIQDSWTVEAGFFVYKVLNFAESGDTYTVLPVTLVNRFDFFLSPDFFFFLYGGVHQSWPIASAQGTAAGRSALTRLTPTGGGGLGFRFGPKWFIRADLGYDNLSVGLALRF